jgi:hypothetical protein
VPGGTSGEPARHKGYTPSKRELGLVTPKRETARRRQAEAPPADRKEALRRSREKTREERAERRAGMAAGDERYLLARDKGPERALVRDIVDRRLTVGTWFFAGALVVIVGSSALMPPVVRLAANMLWITLAMATLADSVLLALRVRQLVRARFPKTQQRMRSLYLYAAMRGVTFRRLRVPRPRVRLGAEI